MGDRLGQIPQWSSGLVAMGLSLYFILQGGSDTPTLLASVFFFFIVAADTLRSKIPNLLNLGLLLASLGYHVINSGLSGLLFSLGGLAVGLVLLLLPYALGGTGAGDVKALAALGSLLGASAIFQVFLYMALIGGGAALLQYPFHPLLRQRLVNSLRSIRTLFLTRSLESLDFSPLARRTQVRFPFAAAIALGFFSFTHWGRIV